MAQFRIQCRGRFVKQHHFRLNDQRPGNGYTLLLTSREFRRIVIGTFAQPDAIQKRHCLFTRCGFALLTYANRAKHHIFQRGEMWE